VGSGRLTGEGDFKMTDAHDGRAGSLVAQALGDALGFLVEGHPPEECAAYARDVFSRDDPPRTPRGRFRFGQYSDDTQLARELALSLAATTGRHGLWRWPRRTAGPRFVPQDFAARVAALFANEKIVGRGRATQKAADRLIDGVPWDRAGEPSP